MRGGTSFPHTTSFPVSLIFPYSRSKKKEKGGKMRDPGNEVGRGGSPKLTAKVY